MHFGALPRLCRRDVALWPLPRRSVLAKARALPRNGPDNADKHSQPLGQCSDVVAVYRSQIGIVSRRIGEDRRGIFQQVSVYLPGLPPRSRHHASPDIKSASVLAVRSGAPELLLEPLPGGKIDVLRHGGKMAGCSMA